MVVTEEGDCDSMRASARVPCVEKNIVEDVGDGEWFGGVSTPREETGVKCSQGVLVGHLRVGGEGNTDDRGSEGAENDGDSASMHEYVTRDVVSDIDSLCQDALGEQVVYRGFLTGQERCVQERD